MNQTDSFLTTVPQPEMFPIMYVYDDAYKASTSYDCLHAHVIQHIRKDQIELKKCDCGDPGCKEPFKVVSKEAVEEAILLLASQKVAKSN